MKLSPLALAVFVSVTLVSVTSAADTGGVRGSIDQTQTRRSLDKVKAVSSKVEMREESISERSTIRNKSTTAFLDAAGMPTAADASMLSMVSTAGANVAVVDADSFTKSGGKRKKTRVEATTGHGY